MVRRAAHALPGDASPGHRGRFGQPLRTEPHRTAVDLADDDEAVALNRRHALERCYDAGDRKSSPVADTRSSMTLGSPAGTKVADPYSASTIAASRP